MLSTPLLFRVLREPPTPPQLPRRAAVPAMTAIEEIFAHSGHKSDRPCGHSSLICDVDAQIAVKRDASENIVATLELSNDGEAGAEIVSRLVPAEVGRDEDGEPIQSCIVVAVDASPPSKAARLSRYQKPHRLRSPSASPP